MMPRRRLLAAIALAGLPFLITPFWPAATALGLIGTFAVATVALLDLLTTPRLTEVEAFRQAHDVLSVGARNPVTVTLRSRYRRPIRVSVHDEPPQPSRWLHLPFEVDLPPGQRLAVTYLLEPQRRGAGTFGRLFLRMNSQLGLWTLQTERDMTQQVKIYPNIAAVRQVELMARQNRLAAAGVRLSRLRGRGSDFDRLREYRREDEYRHIDWKATARQQELVTREYVVEKNQTLLLVLDSGRSMCNEVDGLSHFDRTMNAALLLAYVALRQGDTVGILVCDRSMRRWVAPVRGRGSVEKLISQVYDLQPVYDATDYDLLATELQRRYRKRSLVVLLTHAIDDIHLEAIGTAGRRLRSPHLVLTALLRNVPLEARANAVPRSDLDAFQIAAAAEMVEASHEQATRLAKSGLLVIDCAPAELSSQLISRYLDIKARHLL